MDILLDIERAAMLAGVDQDRIRRLITHGEIESSDGMVAFSSLRSHFPGISLDRADMVDYVAQVKENALAKPIGGVNNARSVEELRAQLAQVERERNHYRLKADGYLALLHSAARTLEAEVGADDFNHRLAALSQWLKAKLRE